MKLTLFYFCYGRKVDKRIAARRDGNCSVHPHMDRQQCPPSRGRSPVRSWPCTFIEVVLIAPKLDDPKSDLMSLRRERLLHRQREQKPRSLVERFLVVQSFLDTLEIAAAVPSFA